MTSLSSLIFQDHPSINILVASYDWSIVALSVLTAIVTSILALQLARIAQSQSTVISKKSTVFAGAVCLGAGIWSMHFIGMMAMDICAEIRYSLPITLTSVVPAVLASWYSLHLLTTDINSFARLLKGGIGVGAGIGVMHYTGMMALQMQPMMQFHLNWVLVSVIVAVGLATLALWVGSKFSRSSGIGAWSNIITGGTLMGLAIAGMHYTGMVASVFIGTQEPDFIASNNLTVSFALGVALVTLLIGILAFTINAIVRHRNMLAEIQVREQHLSTILNTSKDSILMLDESGTIQSFNQAAMQMFGYDDTTIHSLKVNQLITTDDYQSQVKLSNFYNNNIEEIELDQVFGITKSQNRFPARMGVNAVKLNGKTMFVVYISDLSQQRALEAVAKEKELQLYSLMNNIPGVAFRMSVSKTGHHSLILLSSSIKSLTGLTASSYLNQNRCVRDHIVKDERDYVMQWIHNKILAEDKYQIEYRILDIDGKERWISEYGSGHIVAGTNELFLDGVLVDISDSKLKNAAYESIVKAIHRSTCIAEYTTDGNMIDVNQQFLDVMGYQREDVIGKHHSILCPKDFVHTEQYKKKWRDLQAGNYVEGDYLRYGKNGREVWIHASYNPLLDADGKVVKVLLFMIDMTERVTIENALIEAKEKAETATKAKTTFLANMSHEIRTPMNAVIGFSDVLMETELNKQQQNHLKIIQSSAKSLLHLLNDILDSAKLENGKLDFEAVNFSLDQLLDSVVSTLWIQARKKSLQLELKIEDKASGYYLGPEHRIRQVMMNITGNAIKFTEAGKVSIHAKTRDKDTIRITVTDTGVGIPKDRLDVIFDPFTQADSSTSRRFGGTGLGTTISKQLIEGMGGHISVNSEIGTGTCFTIDIPLEAGEKVEIVQPISQAPLPPLNILIADDIAQNRELLTLLLERGGHQITAAKNGREVINQYHQHDFDLLVIDVQMPELDGLEATKTIRQFEQSNNQPETPIIALTASVLQEDREAAKQAGMNGFASKPVDIDALNNQIQKVLGLLNESTQIDDKPAMPSELLSIDFKAGLKRWSDSFLYEKELNGWVDLIPELKHEMKMLSENDDSEEFSFFAHSQKGVAGNLSLLKLERLFANIEQDIKQNKKEGFTASVKAIHQELESIQSYITTNITSRAPQSVLDTPTKYDIASVKSIVLQLKEKAKQAEIDDDLLLQLTNKTANQQKEMAIEIERAFNDFEFQKGESLLTKLESSLNT